MIITIDGPAGSGKSTVARKLAARLQVAYLDTGAMYRAIGHAVMARGADPSVPQELREVARTVKLEVDCGPTHTRVRVDGQDVTEAIRTMAVSAAASHVARDRSIRDLLVEHQRRVGAALGSFVAEGRDQGSVVFPGADVKFVLEATPEKRAERRHREIQTDGQEVSFEAVLDDIRRRDGVDCKQWAPLLEPGAAILIDTTNLTLAEVVDRLAGKVNAFRNGRRPEG
jgi:cytidylate kinase